MTLQVGFTCSEVTHHGVKDVKKLNTAIETKCLFHTHVKPIVTQKSSSQCKLNIIVTACNWMCEQEWKNPISNVRNIVRDLLDKR
jgi:hypothetical protein